MVKCHRYVLMFLLFLCAFGTRPAHAQWIEDGVPVYIGEDQQIRPRITTDGAGGAIICWRHYDYASDVNDVFAQRIDVNGYVRWNPDGVPICILDEDQMEPQICSDGTGGAIIIWRDSRNVSPGSGIYAQRIDADGDTLWTANGVQICSLPQEWGYQNYIIGDGDGGAVITWFDYTNRVCAQHIDHEGTIKWGPSGLQVCPSTPGLQWSPTIAPDGHGGAIITWTDSRNSTPGEVDDQFDIYAQRIDTLGNRLWGDTGAAVCTAWGNQTESVINATGDGGAAIAWLYDRDNPDSADIYAQKIDSSGIIQWDPAGVAICVEPGNQWWPKGVSDGAGGAFFMYRDFGYDNERSLIHVQHVDAGGTVLWQENGIPLGTPDDLQVGDIVADGAGGAYVAWIAKTWTCMPLLVQRLDADGNFEYPAPGIACSDVNSDRQECRLVSDGNGGAIVTWNGDRLFLDTAYDIYAMKICECIGSVPAVPAARFILHQNHPNPFNPVTTIRYFLPAAAHVTLDIYDVAGRRIARLVDEVKKGGAHSIEWRGLNANGNPVSSGSYIYRLRVGKEVIAKKMVLLR